MENGSIIQPPSPPSNLGEWTTIVGEIVAPHGIRGEVQVLPLTEVPERFAEGSELCLVLPDGGRHLIRVGQARAHKAGLILEIPDCETRTEAERLRGAILTIHPAMRPALPPGRYYHSDLVGLRVRTVTGELIGTIREVLETGSNSVFVTERALIPGTREVVRQVDLAGGEMIVQPVPGLLEADES